jgi:hypothetical protein
MPAGNQLYLTSRMAGRPALLKEVVATGAGAATNIAVAGIKPGDVLVSCIEYSASGAVAVQDRTPQTTITSAGNIQVSVATNAAADNRLVVKYYSV